jgi:hypothetical protein
MHQRRFAGNILLIYCSRKRQCASIKTTTKGKPKKPIFTLFIPTPITQNAGICKKASH